jgi:hypothetical protein
MTHHPRVLLLALAASLAFAVASAPVVAPAQDLNHEISLDADALDLVNLIGTIRIAAAPADRYEVRVEIKGRDADPDLVSVEVSEGSEARVRVRFATDRHRDWVYPALGSGSRATIRESSGQDARNWLERLLFELGRKSVTVRGAGRGLEAWADVTVLVPRGKGADVSLGVGSIDADAVDGALKLATRSGSIAVADHRGALTADTGSGSVKVAGCEGALSVDTGSGSVVVSDHRGPSLHVDTGSGRVTIDRAETGKLHVDTGSGGVQARAIGADHGRIDTGSGGITLELDRMGEGPFVLDTGSGGVRLNLPAGASALINVDTGSGGIDARVPAAEVLEQSRGTLRLRVGDGKSNVRIDTGSGAVTITGG